MQVAGLRVDEQQASDDLNSICRQLAGQYPNADYGLDSRLVKPGLMGDMWGGSARNFLLGVMALALLVLLAACANLGSIFAARAADRSRELAIRLAIGCSRWALLRGVLAEAILISLAAGVSGTVLALLLLLVLAWFTVLKPAVKSAAKDAVEPQVTAAEDSANQAKQAAALAAGAAKGAGGGTGGATGGGVVPGLAPTSVDGRLVLNGSGTQSFKVAKEHKTLQITDVVFQNPKGNTGTLQLKRSGKPLMVIGLENFRDLDYHFVSPLVINTALYPALMWNGRFNSRSGDPFDNSLGFRFPFPEADERFSHPRDVASGITHLLQAQAHFLSIDIGLDPDQDSLARLEEIARGGQRVGKADRFELAGRIGEADKGEFVAGFRAALLAMSDGTGKLRRRGALGQRLVMERCPGIDTQALQPDHVIIQRMT